MSMILFLAGTLWEQFRCFVFTGKVVSAVDRDKYLVETKKKEEEKMKTSLKNGPHCEPSLS